MADMASKIGDLAGAGVLTEEAFRRAAEEMLRAPDRPDIELHHARCPKWTSGGRLACRCGAAPLEAVFEDALAESGD